MRNHLTILILLLVSTSMFAHTTHSALWKVIDGDGNEMFASNVYLPSTDIESVQVLNGKDIEESVSNDGYDILIVAKLKYGIVPVTLKNYFKNKIIKFRKVMVNGKEEEGKYPSITKTDMSIDYTKKGKAIDIAMPVTETAGLRIR